MSLQFYAPRIGALFANGPGTMTPLYPLLFGGGQERNFRPGYCMALLAGIVVQVLHGNANPLN